jgi:hypothetical protein
VPKVLKVLLWVVVFAAAAGAGAFMASRSDPFPPGVEDPGARPTNSPTPTRTAPGPTIWSLSMDSDTRHQLHVGGSCRSDWRVTGTITMQPSGRTAGDATARLRPPAACDFPQSQVQTKKIELVVTGKLVGGSLRLAFSEDGRASVGSQDLGGFSSTLSLIRPGIRLPASAHRGQASVKASRPDGDLGTYSSDSALHLVLQ